MDGAGVSQGQGEAGRRGWRPPPGAGAAVVRSGGSMRTGAGVGALGRATCSSEGRRAGGRAVAEPGSDKPPDRFPSAGLRVFGSSASF